MEPRRDECGDLLKHCATCKNWIKDAAKICHHCSRNSALPKTTPPIRRRQSNVSRTVEWKPVLLFCLVLVFVCILVNNAVGGGNYSPSATLKNHMQQYMSDSAYKEAFAARQAAEQGDMRSYREHADKARNAVDLYEQYGGK